MDPGKKTILIVDDSSMIVDHLTEMLNESVNPGLINTAGNYAEAIRLMNESIPTILLLDINLPDKSGIDILRISKEKYPGTKVIMITNQANDFYRKLCMKLGADYFIDKSKEFERIADIIARID